jgi:hypothetical protein
VCGKVAQLRPSRHASEYRPVMDWFAVRHVIEHDGSFEERITLWEASSEDDAIARAEEEAAEYASLLGGGNNALDLFQSYRLPEPPGDGQEVFSLIRQSALPAKKYLDSFFSTGSEFERTGDEAQPER